ncbi:MAG TPA: LacI family DNA-binding transcriptional regulator [Acidimicrobiales bacterium]
MVDRERGVVVTIADVAAHAGVGAGTVSRVLNDSPRVRDTTRARVLAAIELLDYRPNPLARGLSRGRCQTLGVVVPFFTHASAVERLRGVAAALDGSRYDLVLFNVESPVHRDEHFATLTRRDRADGLLIMSLPPPPRSLARLADAGVPVVLLDTSGSGVPAVVTDDVEGGRLATRHLLALGHERIGYITSASHVWPTDERREGMLIAARKDGKGDDVLHDISVEHLNVAHGRDAGERILGLRPRPTAVICANDLVALGVLQVMIRHGVRVPDDMAIVGFDDIEFASAAAIPLTSVRLPRRFMGRVATDLLLAEATGDPDHIHQRIVLEPELVVRQSTIG